MHLTFLFARENGIPFAKRIRTTLTTDCSVAKFYTDTSIAMIGTVHSYTYPL
jgi:hypothetical protein